MLGAVFPREHIGKAFSAFGPVLGLSAVGGPLLAGLLIDANLFGLGWRPMFLINIVLGAAGLAAGLRLLPRDAGDRAVAIDALGSALLAACMLGLLSGLIQGSTNGWTAAPVAALAAGADITASASSSASLSVSGVEVCGRACRSSGQSLSMSSIFTYSAVARVSMSLSTTLIMETLALTCATTPWNQPSSAIRRHVVYVNSGARPHWSGLMNVYEGSRP